MDFRVKDGKVDSTMDQLCIKTKANEKKIQRKKNQMESNPKGDDAHQLIPLSIQRPTGGQFLPFNSCKLLQDFPIMMATPPTSSILDN